MVSFRGNIRAVVFFLFIINLIVFGRFINSDAVLMTTDDNIGAVAPAKLMLPEGVLRAQWHDSVLVGTPGTLIPFTWTSWWMIFLSARSFVNWIHALSLSFASIALYAFLRRRGIRQWACILGICTAYWLASNFTLTYAGHTPKFAVLFLTALTLLLIDISIRHQSFAWAMLSGGVLGLAFMEQQDLALFFGLFLGAHTLMEGWTHKIKPMKFAGLLAAIALVAIMFSLPILMSSYGRNVENVASLQESKQQQWDFCTQWSWPPEESIDFIAPGFTGWRSGEPGGPYWGRMGRSAGWEETRQGFMNFKLENTYLGIIPIALAFFALASCRRSRHRAEIIFWSSATAVALLLAFGKYFPLYYAFWHLPVVHSIRNPNKFLQVFQVALAIMAAYGANALMERGERGAEIGGQRTQAKECKSNRGARKNIVEIQMRTNLSQDAKIIFWFFWGLTGVMILIGLAALTVSLGTRGIAAGFASQGWPPDMARVIASNQGKALWHAFFMATVATVVFGVFAFPRFSRLLRFRNWFAGALVIIVVSDAAWLSRHYVKTMPPSYIAENAVTTLLKNEIGLQRTAMATQESFYNLWLTYLFPYHQIPAFNFTQMPRMPQDYKRFLETVGRNPLRMWQLSAVGYLLAPSGILNQLPETQYSPVLRYDVIGNADGNFAVQIRDTGNHVILRCLAPAPRYALIGGSIRLHDDQALARLTSNEHPLFHKIIIPLDANVKDASGQGIIGQVEVLDYHPGRVRLKVQSDTPGFLRAADKYDPDWKATINGVKTDIIRADFIFQAIYIPAGTHVVELRYNPSNQLLWVKFAGMALWLGTGIWLIIRRSLIIITASFFSRISP
jgi:hypothetical protein